MTRIIALGIASGMKVSEITKMYEDNAQKIFPKQYKFDNYYSRFGAFSMGSVGAYVKTGNLYCSFFMGMVCAFVPKLIDSVSYCYNYYRGYKYTNNELLRVVNEKFGNKKLGDLNNLVCIPSYELISAQNRVFKFPHDPSYQRDRETLLKDVILSTTCAPVYFPPFKHEKLGYLIDGGVWANDPSMVGICEALRFFVGKDKQYERYELLSIGNISYNNNKSPKGERSNLWNVANVEMLLDVMFDSNAKSSKLYCDIISRATGGYYERIESLNISHKVSSNCALDNSDKDVLSTYKTIGYSDGDDVTNESNKRCRDLRRFFVDYKTYNLETTK